MENILIFKSNLIKYLKFNKITESEIFSIFQCFYGFLLKIIQIDRIHHIK